MCGVATPTAKEVSEATVVAMALRLQGVVDGDEFSAMIRNIQEEQKDSIDNILSRSKECFHG